MNIYIWELIGQGLTSNYHSGGGVAVVAPTRERADELLRESARGDDPLDGELDPVDAIYELDGDYEEKVFIFPDAGCC